jgi:hypothetical protein
MFCQKSTFPYSNESFHITAKIFSKNKKNFLNFAKTRRQFSRTFHKKTTKKITFYTIPYSQYGSGSRTAKSMRIRFRIHQSTATFAKIFANLANIRKRKLPWNYCLYLMRSPLSWRNCPQKLKFISQILQHIGDHFRGHFYQRNDQFTFLNT